jgi:hypothetical protein
MTSDLVPVVARPHPFRAERAELELPAGLTLAQMLEVAQPGPLLRRHAVIFVGDWEAPVALWARCRPRPGRRVTICVRPAGGGGGGKSTLRIIAQIAVLAAAIAVPHMAVLGGTMLAVGGALLGAGIGVVGSLLVNALIPPPRPKLGRLGTSAESPTYFLQGARNQPRPFAPVPLVLGEHRTTPPLGALTYTELVGDDQYLRLLVVWGHGPLQITGLRIGETPIASFAGVEVQTRQGMAGEPKLTLFPNTVVEEAQSILLEKGSGWRLRTTAPEADEISLDLTFPRGLVRFDERGQRQERTVQVQIQSRAVGAGGWTDRGTVTVTARQASAMRRGMRFAVARGQHEVRLRR